MVPGRPAQRVRRPLARRPPGRRPSARSRPPPARPPRCRGRPPSSCRSRTGRSARAARPAATAPCRRAARRSGRSRARPGPGRPGRRTGPAPRRSSRPRGTRAARSSWTASSTSSSCATASWSGAPPSASRIASTRPAHLGARRRHTRPRPRAAGRAVVCRGDQTTGIGGGRHVFSMRACSGRMCACHARATWESGSAPCRPGRPTRCSTSPGVGVGHATVHRDEPDPPAGRGVARTGVTAVVLAEDAYHRPVPAGGAVLNGAGECTGFLTGAGVGSGGDAGLPDLDHAARPGVRRRLRARARRRTPTVADDVVIPIVGECDDSFLNDCRRMQVTADDVRAARDAALASRGATTPPDEGAVGAGTGMSCFDFKGGIGTSSRVTADGHTVGVLLLTNFGVATQDLVVAGVPGRAAARRTGGPLRSDAAAGRIVHRRRRHRRAGRRRRLRSGWPAGSGSAWPAPAAVAHNGSGEIFLGFGTGMRLDRTTGRPDRTDLVAGPGLNALFAAVVEATEEAVLNSMFTAPTDRRPGRQHQRVPALPRRAGPAGRSAVVTGTQTRGADPRVRRHRAGRHPLPPTRGRGTAAVPARGAALPQGRPDLVVLVGLRGPPRPVRVRRVPARRARDRVVVRRRHRRVPARGAARPGRGDRVAGPAGVVQRQRRHVRHVVLRLQLAAAGVRAAAGAQGDLRDLRHRRPVDRRRALARWRAAAGRPGRLQPLHDADVRAAARARRSGARAGRSSGGGGWRPTGRGC